MKPIVTVIDYGIGNLLSVTRALQLCGAEVVLTSSPGVIAQAERLVLPGVGAFSDGMEGLRKNNLPGAIQSYASGGRPFLGICLGMQMMLESSCEFGEHPGLGLIPGKVIPVPKRAATGKTHKIPHIGWNNLLQPPTADWQGTLLNKTNPGDAVYFVHSFQAAPSNHTHRLADCEYNGRLLCAAIAKENLYGCQFHPEKSGPAGLRMIAAFLELPLQLAKPIEEKQRCSG